MMLQSFARDSLHTLPFILLFTVLFSVNAFMTYTPADETKTTMFNVGVQKAYGDVLEGKYFCNPDNPWLEKNHYKREVDVYNDIVPEAIKDGISSDEIISSLGSRDVDLMAKCLKEELGIDPDSIAQFSEPVKEIFQSNMELVYKEMPHLVEYTDVPFTGNAVLDLGIIAGGAAGIMTYAKLSGKFSNLFYNKI